MYNFNALDKAMSEYRKTVEALRQTVNECKLLSQNKDYMKVNQSGGGTELEIEIDNVLYLVEYSGEITNYVPETEDQNGQIDFEITINGISQCPKDGISENYIPVTIIDSLIFKQLLNECENHFLNNHESELLDWEHYQGELKYLSEL